MRIIAGIAKGLPLEVPLTGVRPTSDRVRGAIFSSLGAHVTGVAVLDLYAGCGALGLEAASRGACSVTFVEHARQAVASIQKNVKTLSANPAFNGRLRVIRADVEDTLSRLNEPFGLIFADPPYGSIAGQLLANPTLPRLLAPNGLLIVESAVRDALAVPAPWSLKREITAGDTRASFLATG